MTTGRINQITIIYEAAKPLADSNTPNRFSASVHEDIIKQLQSELNQIGKASQQATVLPELARNPTSI